LSLWIDKKKKKKTSHSAQPGSSHDPHTLDMASPPGDASDHLDETESHLVERHAPPGPGPLQGEKLSAARGVHATTTQAAVAQDRVTGTMGLAPSPAGAAAMPAARAASPLEAHPLTRTVIALYSPGDTKARAFLEHTLEAASQSRSHCFRVTKANVVADSHAHGRDLGTVQPDWHEIYFNHDIPRDTSYSGLVIATHTEGDGTSHEFIDPATVEQLDDFLYELQHRCGLTFPKDILDPVTAELDDDAAPGISEIHHDEL
jgi:hypothetical protein